MVGSAAMDYFPKHWMRQTWGVLWVVAVLIGLVVAFAAGRA